MQRANSRRTRKSMYKRQVRDIKIDENLHIEINPRPQYIGKLLKEAVKAEMERQIAKMNILKPQKMLSDNLRTIEDLQNELMENAEQKMLK